MPASMRRVASNDRPSAPRDRPLGPETHAGRDRDDGVGLAGRGVGVDQIAPGRARTTRVAHPLPDVVPPTVEVALGIDG